MFATDPHLQLRPNLAAAFDADFHEFADALLIDRNKGVTGQNTARGVDAEETRGIIT